MFDIKGGQVIGNGQQNLEGFQLLVKYPNNYGASIICKPGSYGYDKGLYELAVMYFPSDNTKWGLIYSTDITNDVIGCLSIDGVNKLLAAISKLDADGKLAEPLNWDEIYQDDDPSQI